MAEQGPPNQSHSNTAKPITVAIDFGTSNSGYAYEYTTGAESKKIDVHVNDWQVSEFESHSNWKTPTIVLLNAQKEFISFGYEAEKKYASLCMNKENKDWYFFRRFKLLLYDTKKLDIKTKIKDETGKEMEAVDVFSKALKYLKDHAITNIMAAKEYPNKQCVEENILWVITVPAIWSDAAKQFMREAATKAGIQTDDLRLVLEPEAASVHCRHSLLRFPGEIGQDATFDTLPEGYKYIVVDMGGGTVDIATHKVTTNRRVLELHSAVGNNIGGLSFNQKFLEFIENLFAPAFTEWKENSSRQFLKMERNIEGIKFKVSSSSEDIVFDIPMSLHTAVLDGKFDSMKAYLCQTGQMNLVSDDEINELHFPNSLARQFFEESIKGITSEIQSILNEIPDIKCIIIVGGLGKSEYILDTIRNAFPYQKVIVPEDPGLSVLKGAVLLGNKPETIEGRIARFTYGIDVCPIFIEGQHREDYRFTRDCKLLCDNVFKRIIEKGEVLKYGQTFSTETEINAKQEDTKKATFSTPFYQSSAISPMYVTDEGCMLLGKIEKESPDGGWPDYSESIVEIVVGEAEFKLYSKDVTNNKTYEIKIDFLFPKTGDT